MAESMVAEVTAARRTTRRSPLRWFTQGGWYFFVVVLSLGVLSPVPFAHAATRLRKPLLWLSPLVYLGLVVTAVAITRPNDPASLGAPLEMGVILLAVVHLIWLRRRAWPAVDLNSAPASAIAAVRELDAATTERIVHARSAAGVPFAQVDDVFAYTDIPVYLWDRIRDRSVTVR